METGNEHQVGESTELSDQHVATDLAPLSIIRTEATLSRFPVHNLSKKGTVTIQIIRKTPKGEVDLKWEVSHNSLYGQPRQLAYKLDTIIINRRIEECGRPIPKIIRLGSLNELCKELGSQKNELKRALQQNATTAINAKVEYRDNTGNTRRLEALFSRYSVVFAGKELPDGRKADAVYLILNDPYWEVINNSPVRPLDYDYLKELPPVAQRFYEIVSRKMFAALKYGHDHAKLAYSEFCTYSAQQRYPDYDHFKKQMYKVHRPHIKSGYIAAIEYQAIVDDAGHPDWLMLYTPGKKARTEFDIFNGTPRARRHRTRKPAITEPGRGEESRTEPALAEPVVEPAVDSALLEALTSRGVMTGAAIKLLANLPADRLEKVTDYVEYFDSIPAEKRGPGLLYSFINNNDPLPSTFETSRSRAARKAAEEHHNRMVAAKQALEVAYADYERTSIDRFILENISNNELERRIAARKAELGSQSSFWDKMRQPELTQRMAEHDVRMDISKQVSRLSFDEFCRTEAPRILREYGLDPVEVGIAIRQTTG